MGPWGVYLSVRLVIGILDFVTDITVAILLLQRSQTEAGCLAIAFPFLAIIFSCISVTADKWIRGVESLSQKKFIVITLTRLTELYEPFFESAPGMILQLTIIWRYV